MEHKGCGAHLRGALAEQLGDDGLVLGGQRIGVVVALALDGRDCLLRTDLVVLAPHRLQHGRVRCDEW